MKKISIFILLIILTYSCMPIPPIVKYYPKQEIIALVDFTKYTDRGFLFTQYPYNGDYKSIGILTYSYRPEAHLEKIKVKLHKDGRRKVTRSVYKYDEIDIYWALDVIYTNALQLGADAIVDLNIVYSDIDLPATVNSNQFITSTIPKLTITGFMIKRKNKNNK